MQFGLQLRNVTFCFTFSGIYYNQIYSSSFPCLDNRSASEASKTETSLKPHTLFLDEASTSVRENDRIPLTSTDNYDNSPPLSPEDNAKEEDTGQKVITNQEKRIKTDVGVKTSFPNSKDRNSKERNIPTHQRSFTSDKNSFNCNEGNAAGEDNIRQILGGCLKASTDESRRGTTNEGNCRITPNFRRQKEKDVKSHPIVLNAGSLNYFRKRIVYVVTVFLLSRYLLSLKQHTL